MKIEELVNTPDGVTAVAAIRSARPELISPADLDFLLSPGYMGPETGLIDIGVRAEDRADELEYPDAESGQQSSIPHPDCGWTTKDVVCLNRRYALQLRAAAHAAYFLAYALMPKKDLEVSHLQDMHKALETLKGVTA